VDAGDPHAHLVAIGADAFPHVSGSLARHLAATERLLRNWGSRDALCIAGLYHAVYGYRTDSGQSVMRRSLVAFIPPWSIAFLLASILAAGTTIRRRRQRADKPPKSPTSTD